MRPASMLLVLLLAMPAWAQAPAPMTADQRKTEQQAAWKAASDAAIRGPAEVPLNGQAKLAVPQGMAFIPRDPSVRLSRALGNQPGADQSGIVVGTRQADEWMVIIRWAAEGYVRDDEAKDLNADDILANLREGTEEGNKDRVARGFPELELAGWAEPPRYDTAAHRLSWAMKVKEKGDPDEDTGINFNTRALGRDGHFSLNLLTSASRLAADRAASATLLSDLAFDPGKRYEDFNASTDKVAAYGLAGLIGVVALKKLGFLALAGAFVLKFAKVGVLALAGIGLAAKRLFRRKPGA